MSKIWCQWYTYSMSDPLHTSTPLANTASSSQQTQTIAQPVQQASTSGAGNQAPVLPNDSVAVTFGNSYFKKVCLPNFLLHPNDYELHIECTLLSGHTWLPTYNYTITNIITFIYSFLSDVVLLHNVSFIWCCHYWHYFHKPIIRWQTLCVHFLHSLSGYIYISMIMLCTGMHWHTSRLKFCAHALERLRCANVMSGHTQTHIFKYFIMTAC